MTEKQYGGATGRSASVTQSKVKQTPIKIPEKKLPDSVEQLGCSLSPEKIQNYKKAGQIAKQVKEYAKLIIKPNMLLLEIADKIENKIQELGGKIAFPVNISINEIAAHYTPSHEDKNTARGLLKIDLGVHINGCIADTAFSLDLENLEENKKLIKASEEALKYAIEEVKSNKEKAVLNKIGKIIKETIEKNNSYPIINLSGHSLDDFQIHAGITIPNCDNQNLQELQSGAFAIEPFATTGLGEVYEGRPSGIFNLQKYSNTRDMFSRKVLEYIKENYKTLPFASRWLVAKFGTRAILSLSMLRQQGILHEYPQLIEKSQKKVSQSEDSFIIHNGIVEVTTS